MTHLKYNLIKSYFAIPVKRDRTNREGKNIMMTNSRETRYQLEFARVVDKYGDEIDEYRRCDAELIFKLGMMNFQKNTIKGDEEAFKYFL